MDPYSLPYRPKSSSSFDVFSLPSDPTNNRQATGAACRLSMAEVPSPMLVKSYGETWMQNSWLLQMHRSLLLTSNNSHAHVHSTTKH